MQNMKLNLCCVKTEFEDLNDFVNKLISQKPLLCIDH